MGLTFPYPKQGNVTRPVGQGCLSCSHSGYCPAAYWFRRNSNGTVDQHVGIRCLSWSNNPADRPTVIAADDLDENDYLNIQGELFDTDYDQRMDEPG